MKIYKTICIEQGILDFEPKTEKAIAKKAEIVNGGVAAEFDLYIDKTFGNITEEFLNSYLEIIGDIVTHLKENNNKK